MPSLFLCRASSLSCFSLINCLPQPFIEASVWTIICGGDCIRYRAFDTSKFWIQERKFLFAFSILSCVDNSDFSATLIFAFVANNELAVCLGGLPVLLMKTSLLFLLILKSILEVPCTFLNTTDVFFLISLGWAATLIESNLLLVQKIWSYLLVLTQIFSDLL